MTTPERLAEMARDRIYTAAVALVDMFDGYTGWDIATSLTCPEADALAELFEACGHSAEDFLDAHAAGDDGGDEHYDRIDRDAES